MSGTTWEVDKMLDIYIYDYLMKRKLHNSAKSFQTERKLNMDPSAIDVPGGFLFEWWSVFWDIYITRTNKHHSEAAASYIETQVMKSKELRLQQQQYVQKTQQNQLMEMQQLVRRQRAQQQREHRQPGVQPLKKPRDGSNRVKDTATIANKMVMEKLDLLHQRDDMLLKVSDPNHALLFRAADVGAQPFSQIHGSQGDSSQSIGIQNQSQQLPGIQNLKSGMNSMLNYPVNRTMESFLGSAGSDQGTCNLSLKGSPLTGSDQFRSGLLQQSKFSTQLPQDFNQFQLQHQLMLQAPENLGIPSANMTFISKGVSFNNQSMDIGKDNQLSLNDESNVESLVPVCSQVLPPVDADMLIKADVDHVVDDETLDRVESFPCPDKSDLRDEVGCTFKEIHLLPASTHKVECCRFSSDGKFLASGGHDKKATIWCTESFAVKSTFDEHSQLITDVCFSPRTLKIATSSDDRTVKVWGVGNPGHSLRTFTGHSTGVTSLDFHPSKDDLFCSCDTNSEIRYWSVKNGCCVGIFKGGATQLRFQPNNGRILAAAVGSFVSIIDVETQVCRLKLQGHKNHIRSVCWDPSGEYVASVSDDLAVVWKVGSGSKGNCIHELKCCGNKFHACAFHPTDPSLLIIGSYESLELWNMTENKTRTLHAHDNLISSLAVSNVTGLVASASHDNCIKVWQ